MIPPLDNSAIVHFPPHLFTIIFFVLFITFPKTNCASEYYKTCSSPWTCGSLPNVSFPFWGTGRPGYCGLQEFRLDCGTNTSSDHPILNIGRDNIPYRVLAINNSDFYVNIKLQNMAFEQTCNNILELNNTLRRTDADFNFVGHGRDVEMIQLFYNCRHNITDVRHSITWHCPLKNVTGFYLPNSTQTSSSQQSCKSAVEVPVLRRELGRLNNNRNETLEDVLKEGFEINYDATDCSKCKESGGVCGWSESHFKCYCKDEFSRGVFRKPGAWKLIVGLVIGGFLLLAVNCGFCFWLMMLTLRKPTRFTRLRSSTDSLRSDLESGTSFHGIPLFSYSELQEATDNFDSARELGDGGFGIVYYGQLQDGREVAVKRLYEKKYKRVGQFMNEVEILTCLRHPNLVTLYGCSSRHSRELLLVYEYVPNGTVADHLYGDRSKSKALTWKIRMKIAVETATALSYLHTSDIVHRDVKTNNILLDSNFSVKVADFGLSRLFPIDVTHVSTAPQGTPGYLDPEYHKCYQVTTKSDVYSFGVLLVELISSLPAVDINRQEHEINLSDYALKRIQKGQLVELVDETLGFQSDFKTKRMIALVAELAFQCLQKEKGLRPSMNEVFEALKRIESLDYEALEAVEMDKTSSVPKSTSVEIDHGTEKKPASPSSVMDNWAMRSGSSNPSS